MSTFISNIKASDGATQHAAGFQKAFQLLRNTTSLSKPGTSKKNHVDYLTELCACYLGDQFQFLTASRTLLSF